MITEAGDSSNIDESLKTLRHNLNGHMAVIGSFLACCQNDKLPSDLLPLLHNANISFREILKILEKIK